MKDISMRAMILAAGRGERMRPLTDQTPKPLLAVAGKPLIVWHIERLVHAGITELVINHAHLGAQIERLWATAADLVRASNILPKRMRWKPRAASPYALPLLGDEPFAVVNGDIYCDYDFAQLARSRCQAVANSDTAHLVLVNNPAQHPGGDFGLHQQRVTDSAPKHSLSAASASTSPSCSPASRAAARRRWRRCCASRSRWAKSAANITSGIWVDVGTPQRLAELDSQVCALQKTSCTLHNTP